MLKYDIALLTEARHADTAPLDSYQQDVLNEDKVLAEELLKYGLTCVRVDWADETFDWTHVKYGMLRSTWDYFYKIDKFKTWLSSVEKNIKLINPITLVRWNIDKHYLIDLERQGVSIVPTTFVEKGESADLKEIYTSHESEKIIVKPAISGSSRHTYLVDNSNVNQVASVFQKLMTNECMLIQPFISTIAEYGEVSFLVFDGIFSHAILKKSKEGDFRVQSDFGGSLHHYQASKEEIIFAETVVAKCDQVPVYARVDVAKDQNGKMLLVELELIEPDMWLRLNEGSASKLAKAVKQHITQE